MSRERRKELVKLVFGYYARTLPNGRPVLQQELPEPLVAQLADSPIARDLDRHLDYGVRQMRL